MAKERFGRNEDVPVRRSHEAGRDAYRLQRWLRGVGIEKGERGRIFTCESGENFLNDLDRAPRIKLQGRTMLTISCDKVEEEVDLTRRFTVIAFRNS